MGKKKDKIQAPMVCELLIECAEEYGYDAPELIYNYAMSFSHNIEIESDSMPAIMYNLSYINQSNLSKKEKAIIKKISKNTKDNNKIDVIDEEKALSKMIEIFENL